MRKDASNRKGQPKSATTIMSQTNKQGRERMSTFEQAKEVLKRCFGHDGFRPEQERAIRAIMGKRDVLAAMSTRAGKTLIHQLPTVALGGHYRFIASQGDTAPKQGWTRGGGVPVSLPVRVTLLQN